MQWHERHVHDDDDVDDGNVDGQESTLSKCNSEQTGLGSHVITAVRTDFTHLV